jgi:hypothetical protein
METAMTEAHGLVERYGENKIVEVTAFTSRPGILTGLPGPNTTTATGPSRGIPIKLAPASAAGCVGDGSAWPPGCCGWLTVSSGVVDLRTGGLVGNHVWLLAGPIGVSPLDNDSHPVKMKRQAPARTRGLRRIRPST